MVCQKGAKLSQGAAAWLRHEGVAAEILEGGFEEWRNRGLPLVPKASLPARDVSGRTIWVTLTRPKVDRIACQWLIRRFVDSEAVFPFVAPAEVEDVGSRFGATPFDTKGVHWSHRGELCTFDVMVQEFGLSAPALDRLARIVRGADTARLDLEPEAPGLLAASLGLSRIYTDDLAQLNAGMALYDAIYRWCRSTTGRTERLAHKGRHHREHPCLRRGAAAPGVGGSHGCLGQIGPLSFGGPAGQIALMHRELLDERRWISDARFLHALKFCMLLPRPEAQQLAVYIEWVLHGTRGGLIAGTLFILPGFAVIMPLSTAYALLQETAWLPSLFFGLKAAVLAVVVQALIRIGKRALRTPIAAAAFISL